MYINQTYKFLSVLSIVAASLFWVGCAALDSDNSTRTVEFSPNMYNSIPLEPYTQTVDGQGNYSNPYFANNLSAQHAPEGTVPRDSWYVSEEYTPFHYSTDPVTGYDSAGLYLRSPMSDSLVNEKDFNCSEESFQAGQRIYSVYCVMCHGAKGEGKGKLVTDGVFGNVPSYKDSLTLKYLPEGKMFYSLTYGKGIMGSYASQLTPRERWEVICYIQKFQQED